MAGQTEQQMLTLLANIQDQLHKLNISTAAYHRNQEKYKDTRKTKTAEQNLDKLDKSTVNLTKTITKAEREFEKSAVVFGRSLKDVIREHILPGAKSAKEAMKEWADTLEDIEKNQTGQFKELAANTRDFIKRNKNATSVIKEGIDAHLAYNSVLKNISKNQNKVNEDDIKNVRELSKVIKKLQDEGNIRAMQGISYKQFELLKNLHKKTKLTSEEFRSLADVSKKVGQNFEKITGATEQYFHGLSKAQQSMQTALATSLKSMVNNIKLAVGAAAPQVFKDLMSQARNAVAESNYTAAARLGVSQADLSDFMGQNRLALRSLGGGNSSAPIANGQINQLQNQAHSYGVTGDDALKLIGTTFNSLVKMGASADQAGYQMQQLYMTMQQTGMTLDELNTVVGDLSSSPAFVELAQAKGFDGQADQLNVLVKMLKTQGYSADYLKQLLDLNKQNTYQGIAEAVKGQVGIQLLTGQINRTLGREAISAEDSALLQEMKLRGGPQGLEAAFMAGIYKDRSVNGKSMDEMFGTGAAGAANFSKYVLNKQLDVNRLRKDANLSASVTGNAYSGLVDKTLMNTFGDLAGSEYSQMDAATMAAATLKSLTGSTTPGQDAIARMMGASDSLVSSIKDVDNAFIPFGETLNGFVAKFQEGLKGFGSNPLGQASGGVAGAVKDIVQSILIYKGITKLAGFAMGGAGPGIMARMAGMGSGVMAKATGLMGGASRFTGVAANAIKTGAGIAGRGALAAAGPTGMVLGAGAAGYGIGSMINVAPEYIGKLFGTQFDSISTNIVDGIWKLTGKDAALDAMLNPTNLTKNLNAEVEKTVTPEGHTMGELFLEMLKSLTHIDDNQKKLIQTYEQIHRENMDLQLKKANGGIIEESLLQTRTMLGAVR